MATSSPTKIGIQVRIHPPALAALRGLSAVRGLPASELIRRAIDEFLERHSPRPKAKR